VTVDDYWLDVIDIRAGYSKYSPSLHHVRRKTLPAGRRKVVGFLREPRVILGRLSDHRLPHRNHRHRQRN
jgi:hypothetical protein